MSRRRPRAGRRAVMAILLVLGLFLASSPPVEQPPRHRLQAGIAYGDTLVGMSNDRLAQALDDAVGVGATWIRADLSWSDVQHDGAGDYRWSGFDRVLDAAGRRGLRVLPVLAYTPPWARPPGCGLPTCAPADPAAFARFAAAAARRYAPHGLQWWEIWNEPNIGFWKPAPDPAGYTALLRATSTAIRSVDGSARLLVGGLAATATGPAAMAQADFLAAVLRAGGGRFVDAVAYHPYTFPYLASDRPGFRTAWERIAAGPDSLRAVLTRYGYARMPIWVTEVGAPTGGPGHVSEDRQAAIAADVVATAAAEPLVGAVFWYSDRDLSNDPSTSENFFGLRRADGSAKPAYRALGGAVDALGR